MKYTTREQKIIMKNKSYKFSIYPNVKQSVLLFKTFGCVRFIYNYFLNERIDYYRLNKTLKGFKQSTEKQLKEQFEWLKEVDSIALQQARLNLNMSYNNFFRKIKNKEATSFKFKSRKDTRSFRTIKQGNSVRIDFKNKKIKIPKIGFVNYRDDRKFDETKISSITISRNKSGKFFVSILVKENVLKKEPINQWIGIDLGIKTFIVCSNGEKIENPKIGQSYEIKLAKEQRKLSRKIRDSNNRNKQRIKIAKIYEKIENKRSDFLQKLSTKLINENQVICLENLNISGMIKNHKLAKSIQDCSWSKFVLMLKYKAEWYGRNIVLIGTFFPSSKLCSVCGYKLEKLDLSIREWMCPDCHSIHDRDLNASINILQEGINLLGKAGTALTQACGEMKQPALLPTILDEAGILRL